ncbi:MAG: ROK family protein [Desulfobacteraceae bacterium]
MDRGGYRMGIDLGGTKIESVLIDVNGEIHLRKRIPTPRTDGDPAAEYQGIVDAVVDLIDTTRAHVPKSANCTIGVGIPGTINPKTQRVQNANTTCLAGRPFKKDLEIRLGRPIGMENDANCFTVAEARQGAGKGYAMVYGIIMGTGCGGGLCIDGRLHRGRHQIAGEWGHLSVDPKGAVCYCGNPGCVETKISGAGVENAYAHRYGDRLSMQRIISGYRRGDSACRTIFEQFIDDFGRCMGGLISMLDPDAVVLGGGLSNIEELYTIGVQKARTYAFHEQIETPILKNRLGDSAGVFGAAGIGK